VAYGQPARAIYTAPMTTTTYPVTPDTAVTAVRLSQFLEVFTIDDLYGRWLIADVDGLLIENAELIEGVITHVQPGYRRFGTTVVRPWLTVARPEVSWSPEFRAVEDVGLVEVTGAELAVIEAEDALR
jgi:hypothetical protein